MSLLEIKDVSSGYGEVQILWGTDMALEEGKLTSLVGANGAGKADDQPHNDNHCPSPGDRAQGSAHRGYG